MAATKSNSLRSMTLTQLRNALTKREEQIKNWTKRRDALQARMTRLNAKLSGLSGRKSRKTRKSKA